MDKKLTKEDITKTVPKVLSEVLHDEAEIDQFKSSLNGCLQDLLLVLDNYKRQGYKIVYLGSYSDKTVKALAEPLYQGETEAVVVLATPGFEMLKDTLKSLPHYHLITLNPVINIEYTQN